MAPLPGKLNPCMPYWIRDQEGRLVRIETPRATELDIILEVMENQPEDQHSQHGQGNDPNLYRSMRDRMHPPRMSAPSCIIPPTEQPYGNTYNSNWRNHPNFAWKPRPNPYQSPAQSSQQSQGQSSVEQALVSLSKVMGDFVSEQKTINSQLNQKIDNVESTLNKKIDGMHNELSQKIDNIQYSISRLTNLNTVNEKGKFPSQPHQNPKGIHEVESKDEDSSKVRDVQAIITLRSGKEVHQPEHDKRKAKEDKADRKEEKKKEQKGKEVQMKESIIPSMDEEPQILLKEEMMKNHIPPPFPQALWTGPFIIHEVHPNGVVEIFNPTGNQTFKVNGHRLKPFIEPYSTDKEEINLLEPPQI
ncbi:hypothetical protein CK203_034850 [Vitis vinifera]|uniref:Uncharacterized protein n=1 Tax=Vitis vinifera TaxID=29760 RepID=A0A438IBZ0_VITVI|nr:hypothetical protein CK203_034850 [Vitis vinifera]